MDFNVISQALGIIETVFEGNAEQAVDGDITLSEYYPDIQRILKCSVIPGITGAQASSDRITVDGTALVRVLYVGEDGKIRGFEQNYPFTKTIETSAPTEGACVSVRAKTDYVNCRAVSQRRVNIHGVITINVKIRKKRSDEIITDAEGFGIQLMRKSVPAVSMTGCSDKMFTLSEVVEIGQGSPPITQIIRTQSYVLVSDAKAISNKLLLKGELVSKILYCADSDNGELTLFEHSMPISQIIEVEGITEDSICDVSLNVALIEITPKADSNGELRLVEINAKVNACVSSCTQIEIPVVVDAYSVSHDLKTDFKQADISGLVDNINDSFTAKGALEISDMKKMLDVWCGDLSCSCSVRNSDLIISGSIPVFVLYINNDNQADFAEKSIDFEFRKNAGMDIERIKCEPNIVVTDCSSLQSGEGKIDVRVEMNIVSIVLFSQRHRFISNLEPTETELPKNKISSLTIYFTEDGEDVWDIARRYNTTVDAIMQENGLEDSRINQKSMLMIPKA